MEVTDGTSNTLMVGERGIPDDYGFGWPMCGGTECEQHLSAQRAMYKPLKSTPYNSTLDHYWSWHPSTAGFLFVDGSVHFLRFDLDVLTFQYLSTRNGGEATGNAF
jgi:prepilin-type processing-associated H-X9-DG protein